MKNTALFLVMGIIYALSSDMDYLDAEMMRRNSQDVIATTPQAGELSWVIRSALYPRSERDGFYGKKDGCSATMKAATP